MHARERLDAVADDVRFTLRQLRRAPGFAAAVITTFALGIGANATMFSVVDRLLLRPPAHVRDPARIVQLAAAITFKDKSGTQSTFPYATYAAFRERLRGADVSEVAATIYGTLDLPLGRGERARSARGSLVSASYFPLLGVRPALGRFFLEDEDVPPVGAAVAVIGYGLWQRELGGERAALGRELEIGTRRYTIVGVAPQGFTGTNPGAIDVWLPIASAEGLRFPGSDWVTSRLSTWIRVYARLAPGASRERLEARASAVNLESGEPRMVRMNAKMLAIPLSSAMRGDAPGSWRSRGGDFLTARVAALLGIVSGLVLLIACANVANLLLARALRRRQEISVRLALGASRGRLVAQLLTESTLLALLGGGAALVIARWGWDLLRALLFGDLRWDDAPLDARVLAFTAAVTALVGVLAGLVPALQASRPSLTAALKAGARDGGVQRLRARTALLVLQAALAVVLLVGTGLFVRSLRNLYTLHLGMEPDRVLLATMDLKPLGVKPPDVDALFRRMEERVRALPGVASAAVAVTVAGKGSWGANLIVLGRDSLPQPEGGSFSNAVRPDFFRTIGTRVLRGREFTAADESSAAPVIIVNETFARHAWPGADALDKCVKLGGDTTPCRTVVGVVENARRQDWVEDENFFVYVPLAQAGARMTQRLLVVRPAGTHPERLVPAVRGAMQTASPNLPYAEVYPMSRLFANELRPWRLGAAMFGAFGALAILLAAVGLYGVISFSVGQLTREVGVRIALGARAADVLALVLRQGLTLTACGGSIGLLVALMGGRFVEPLLFRVPARDPWVLAAVVACLFLVAVAATLVPAWRATRVNPASALRVE